MPIAVTFFLTRLQVTVMVLWCPAWTRSPWWTLYFFMAYTSLAGIRHDRRTVTHQTIFQRSMVFFTTPFRVPCRDSGKKTELKAQVKRRKHHLSKQLPIKEMSVGVKLEISYIIAFQYGYFEGLEVFHFHSRSQRTAKLSTKL